MDRVLKKQLLEMMELLREAHRNLKELMDRNNIDAAIGLLSDCQDGAIQLGTMIEESEGDGLLTVNILEEYCEVIFRRHQALVQDEMAEAEVVCAELENVLDRAKESMEKDIKVRKEVVFLPYKASMWDSLESVWVAADTDPECDAYVIPIPYFDRKADGNFGEMHYEGDEYPQNVPVIDYHFYDFATRRPDMIYIHNPYDEHNTVTSVHPFFYAKNLKKYTDNLVYIPYFVLGEVNPQSKAALDGIEHFVMTSGVLQADTVILQSEDMRQAYIEVLCREVGEHTREIWEKKIKGTGSPKYDKLRRTKKEELAIPKEWLRILRRPDGSLKKVILYNTGVTALLEQEEEMLGKMERVFQIFRENRKEVALLWRPHPLLKATIVSMRPQLWEAYEQIVEQYREEGWGIYDDTAELDRAIALCDAYYGDDSSLVQLCREAGKTVMIQNVYV